MCTDRLFPRQQRNWSRRCRSEPAQVLLHPCPGGAPAQVLLYPCPGSAPAQVLISIIFSVERVDDVKASGPVHLLAKLDKLVDRDIVKLLVSTDVDGYRILGCFLIAKHEDIRIAIVVEGLDLGLHVDVVVVSLNTDSMLKQQVFDLVSVLVVLRTDRDDADLHRGEPEGEVALEVLDDDSDKRSREP